MLSISPPTEADRIALTKMFKAIAEYGRKVRLGKLANCEKPVQEVPQEPELECRSAPRKRKSATKSNRG